MSDRSQREQARVTAEQALVESDDETRRERADRLVQIIELRDDHLPEGTRVTVGGSQALWLLEEAESAYIQGLFLSTLVTAHAMCERELAGRLMIGPGEIPPRGWERWGLGKLIGEAEARGTLAGPTVDVLAKVNARRKSLVHYRRSFDVDSFERRLIRIADKTLPGLEPTLDKVWANDALLALRGALLLLASNPYLGTA